MHICSISYLSSNNVLNELANDKHHPYGKYRILDTEKSKFKFLRPPFQLVWFQYCRR